MNKKRLHANHQHKTPTDFSKVSPKLSVVNYPAAETLLEAKKREMAMDVAHSRMSEDGSPTHRNEMVKVVGKNRLEPQFHALVDKIKLSVTTLFAKAQHTAQKTLDTAVAAGKSILLKVEQSPIIKSTRKPPVKIQQ